MNKLLLTAFSLLLTTCCFAQPGTLDSDFDADGMLTTDFNSLDDYAKAVAAQPDGKILVAGYATIATTYDFALVRYNTDGTLDNTFGTGGKVTTSFTTYDDEAVAMALQPDGKIILAGSVSLSNNDIALMRYNSNGTPDNSFGSSGQVVTDFNGANDFVSAITLKSDGKILVGGSTHNTALGIYEFMVVCYNSNGTLDNSFGTGGKVSYNYGSDHQEPGVSAIIVQPDGKIVVCGTDMNNLTDRFFALARLNSDGTFDNSFSVDGKLTTALGDANDATCTSAVLQPDGKIIAAGYALVGTTSYMAAARYKTDGTLDTGFDGDGKLTTEPMTFSGSASAVLLQPDGKIVLSGASYEGVSNDFALVRLNANGSADNTFGTAGIVQSPVSVNYIDYPFASTLTPDLKIVLAGYVYNSTDFDMAVARFLTGLNLGVLEFTTNTSALIYPNPVNETTTLSFELAGNETLSISICDAQGRMVKSIAQNQLYTTGKHEVTIDATQLASGHYTLVIENQTGKTTVRLMK